MSKRTREANRADKLRTASRCARSNLRREGCERKRNGIEFSGELPDFNEVWQQAAEVGDLPETTRNSPFHPERSENLAGEAPQFYWWDHPNLGRVLVLDPHELTVAQAIPLFERMAQLANQRFTFVVHGYNRGTRLRDAMIRHFGHNKCVTFSQNPGLSRVDLY